MSRYLKAVPASGAYTIKKVFSTAGATTQAFPSTTSVAKVMVFGGGGNACPGYIYDPGCSCFCQSCLCYACIMHNSGAGGGFTEKLFSGVAGLTACIIVGAAEGTSSACIPGLGTITATGGTSTCLNASPGSLPRCTTGGAGSCGDINKCGSLGACRITSFVCNCCNNGCLFASGLVAVPGGAPGNSINAGVAPTVTTNQIMCCIFCCRQSNPTPYGTSVCNCNNQQVCVFCDLPKGFGACPLETDKFYAYDWDVVGGGKCDTSGNPTASTVTAVLSCACTYSSGSMSGCTAIQTITIPSTYATGTQGGIAGSGGVGGVGGTGGGGGGVFSTTAAVRCICSSDCVSGGSGLVVVYF